MRKKNGFTLIELIIVLTILGILALIIVNVFVSFIEKSKETACLSNRAGIEKAERIYYTLNGHDSGGENSTFYQLEAFEDSYQRLASANLLPNNATLCPESGTYRWSEPNKYNERVIICSKHEQTNPTLLEHAPIEGLTLSLNLNDSLSFLDDNQFDYVLTGTDNEAIQPVGILGSGFVLDGERENISINDDDRLDLSDEGTLMAWVYLNSKSQFGGIIHKGEEVDFSDEAYSLQFFNFKPTLHLIDKNGSEHTLTTNTPNIKTKEWYQICGTWDNSGMKLYVNGNLVKENNNSVDAINSDGPLQIGSQLNQDYNWQHNYFTLDGIIDEVGIYSRALSQVEIEDYYNDVLSSK